MTIQTYIDFFSFEGTREFIVQDEEKTFIKK